VVVGKTQLFFDAVASRIISSTALSAKLGTEAAANHVIYRRFRRGSEDSGHAQRVLLAPMIYIWPGSSSWSPMTENNGRVESTVNVTVVQSSKDSGATFGGVLEFADQLVTELMQKADGTGGNSSFLSGIGFNLRARIETPAEDGNAGQPEVRLNIVFTDTLIPAV